MLPSLLRHANPPGAGASALLRPCRMAFAMTLMAFLAACGQKGPLVIPDTPPAAQRATLPQTVFGGGGTRSDKHKAGETGQTDTEGQQQRQDARDAWPDPDFDDQP